jgi:hypothetical protein
MPLDTAALSSALDDLFVDPPKSADACAAAWAAAMKGYAAEMVPPSSTVSSAADALEGALPAAFKGAPAALETAFGAFAATVSGGILPTFVGAPPPAPVGFAALLATMQDTRPAAAAAFTTKIDTWFRTGTATLVAPPNTVTTWS